MKISLKKQQNRKSILTIALAVVFLISFLLMPGVSTAFASSTSTQVTNLDNTTVMDDLLSDDDFDILNYPFEDYESAENSMFVINFVEYCYTYKLDLQSDYALYIYVYNPRGVEIDTTRTNKVTMAVEFDDDLNPTSYEKFDLKFISASTGSYANLFYKFKVENASYFLDIVNSLERDYFVSELEIQEDGYENANTQNVSTLYTYTGYALGLGSDATASTLECSATAIESVTLDVNHTYYRTGTVSNNYEASQINSVYFAVPDSIIEKYGSLYSIHAEWYEYMTRQIALCASNEMYNALLPYVGVDLSESSSIPVYGFGIGNKVAGVDSWSWGYNTYMGKINYNLKASGVNLDTLDTLTYLFSTNGKTGKYLLDGETLADYIYNYSSSYENGTLDVDNSEISADLFLSEADFNNEYWSTDENTTTRTMGYNNVNITIDDSVSMKTISQNDWWDRLWGNDKTITENEISPIVVVDDDVLTMTDNEICNTYLISENDVDDFVDYYRTQSLENNTVILFRFASTNYTAQAMLVKHAYQGLFGIWLSDCSYTDYPTSIAQENVFLNFDIIDLTFTTDGIYYVLPVVASPIDIISDVEVSIEQSTPWWTWLLIAVIAIAVLICFPILLKIFKFLFNCIVWIVSLPFELIHKISANKRRSP